MSIDYRLVTCSPAPAAYQDVLCAIRWVHANAHRYGLDRDRIFPIGMSSGGHLASLAATLGEGRFPRTGGWDEYPSSFRAAICVSGAFDIVSLDWGAGWAPPGEPFPDAREYASPIRHVAPGNVPQLILHSDDDPSIPIEQVLRMTRGAGGGRRALPVPPLCRPGAHVHHRRGDRRSAGLHRRAVRLSAQPRPTNGILVAMIVMKRTFESSGRAAIWATASPT